MTPQGLVRYRETGSDCFSASMRSFSVSTHQISS